MGNSQSYDVTNVHHRHEKRAEPSTGTVKPLRDEMPVIETTDEREKQENQSPQPTAEKESPVVTRHEQGKSVKSYPAPVPEQQTHSEPEHRAEEAAVQEVSEEHSEVALDTLHRVVPPETIPLEAAPSQSSYEKLDH
ncbi:hypothetical protein Q1695_010859 [Nippostrongylus brasiliensis]|nr:hypothetical protein Q1695_010859 [Nippostrongylus brasiliensis]